MSSLSFRDRAVRLGRSLHTAFRRTRVGLWRFKRNPEQQDRASMIATFALIGAFALGSVDAVVTGGADFGPSAAYAGEYRSAPIAMAPAAPAIAAVEDIGEVVKSVAPQEIDYSFTTEVLLGGPDVAGDEIISLDTAPELSPTY